MSWRPRLPPRSIIAAAPASAATSTPPCTKSACSRCTTPSPQRIARRTSRSAWATPTAACFTRACIPHAGRRIAGSPSLASAEQTGAHSARSQASTRTRRDPARRALAAWTPRPGRTRTGRALQSARHRRRRRAGYRGPDRTRSAARHRGALVTLDHPLLGPFGHVRTPLAFSRSRIEPFRAPRIGEHTRARSRDSPASRRAHRGARARREFSNESRRSPGQRSRKQLECTQAATAYQRSFVAELKRRVVDNGEPFAIAQADTPHEIFHAMDIRAGHQSMVVRLHLREAALAALLQGAGRSRLSRQQLPLLLARPRLHARQRSGDGALGRPAEARRCWSRG